MMKKLLIIIAVFFAFQSAQAQNESIYNHYHINPILVNPAVAGFDDMHKVQANARIQWVGFEGAPKTYSMTYNGPIGKTFGIGAMVFTENIAALSRTRLQLDYAFRYKLENVRMSFGFSTEWSQERVTKDVFSDPAYDLGDILLEEAVDGRNSFDASLGAYALIKEKTFVGISFPNLISSRIGDIVTGTEESSLFNYYTVMAGHKFGIEGTDFELEPSILMKQLRNTPFQVDFNVKANFLDEKITTGLSYRSGTGGAIGLLLGTKINTLKIYYSYDVSFQRFQRYNSGSHEATVSFEFGGKDKDSSKKFR